jgi:FKBP-type peptidyl-prolyl cis-trans isomerase FkpA/FKBP-type peptidyl-prolyl cis-trans isomerase FklB
MMKIGDKWQLFVPADLAYGPSGRKDPRSGQFIIPPNATLLFELELLSIKGSPRDE